MLLVSASRAKCPIGFDYFTASGAMSFKLNSASGASEKCLFDLLAASRAFMLSAIHRLIGGAPFRDEVEG